MFFFPFTPRLPPPIVPETIHASTPGLVMTTCLILIMTYKGHIVNHVCPRVRGVTEFCCTDRDTCLLTQDLAL